MSNGAAYRDAGDAGHVLEHLIAMGMPDCLDMSAAHIMMAEPNDGSEPFVIGISLSDGSKLLSMPFEMQAKMMMDEEASKSE